VLGDEVLRELIGELRHRDVGHEGGSRGARPLAPGGGVGKGAVGSGGGGGAAEVYVAAGPRLRHSDGGRTPSGGRGELLCPP